MDDTNLYLHYGDLADAVQLVKLLYDLQPDEIYNLGAQSHVRVSTTFLSTQGMSLHWERFESLKRYGKLVWLKKCGFTKPLRRRCSEKCRRFLKLNQLRSGLVRLTRVPRFMLTG